MEKKQKIIPPKSIPLALNDGKFPKQQKKSPKTPEQQIGTLEIHRDSTNSAPGRQRVVDNFVATDQLYGRSSETNGKTPVEKQESDEVIP